MGGKYSKTKLVSKRWIAIVILILAILLVLSITFVIYINVANLITFEKVKSDSNSVNDNIASSSTPVIVNNIIVGAVYDGKWVSTERYYFKSTFKEKTDVDVFTADGKTGTFKLNEIRKNNEQSTAYTSTTRTNYVDEYYAIVPGSNGFKISSLKLDDNSVKVYTDYVKKALGMYNMLNGTIKIKEVNEVYLTAGKVSYVITATNSSSAKDGVYSSVVFVDPDDKISLVKYNFLKNTENSEDFSIYSVKFVSDLNNDGKSEIILQETKEFDTKYCVMEYINGQFYEVLSSKFSNKK